MGPAAGPMADSILSNECRPPVNRPSDEILFDGRHESAVDLLLFFGRRVLAHTEEGVPRVARLGQVRALHALDVELHQGLQDLPTLTSLQRGHDLVDLLGPPDVDHCRRSLGAQVGRHVSAAQRRLDLVRPFLGALPFLDPLGGDAFARRKRECQQPNQNQCSHGD